MFTLECVTNFDDSTVRDFCLTDCSPSESCSPDDTCYPDLSPSPTKPKKKK